MGEIIICPGHLFLLLYVAMLSDFLCPKVAPCPAQTLCVNQGWKRMHRIRLTKRKRVGIRPGTILLLFVSIRTPANVPNIGYTYVLCMDWVTFGISPNNVYCTEAGGIPCIRRIQRGGQSTTPVTVQYDYISDPPEI